MDIIVDDHIGKKNPFCYARGLAPSPKILTKVIIINSFGDQIFSHVNRSEQILNRSKQALNRSEQALIDLLHFTPQKYMLNPRSRMREDPLLRQLRPHSPRFTPSLTQYQWRRERGGCLRNTSQELLRSRNNIK